MDWFRLPTDQELYFTDVIFPHIAKYDFDEENHAVILEWRAGTPEEVKKRALKEDNIIVKAK
ncbi:MAG TPA: hypothetical protein K8V48_05765 [Limosilactobacillus oris]|uniref:hypothetical protein n=1 Tax=Limosilactobacillus oris TaxID=1632 RepID=UPI000789D773|nr:hypothetical protein [Limosilactobacillus oris]AMS07421.1 hypothetical protein AYI71_00495 [Limosilactobacillus oris]HJF47468.1 hypothetical protein [Limosilactobacillus oris]